MTSDTIRIAAAELQDFAKNVFIKVGLPSEDAAQGRPLAEAYLPMLLDSAIGVLRRGRQIVFAGELRGQLKTDEPELKAAIDDLCGVAPKEEPER